MVMVLSPVTGSISVLTFLLTPFLRFLLSLSWSFLWASILARSLSAASAYRLVATTFGGGAFDDRLELTEGRFEDVPLSSASDAGSSFSTFFAAGAAMAAAAGFGASFGFDGFFGAFFGGAGAGGALANKSILALAIVELSAARMMISSFSTVLRLNSSLISVCFNAEVKFFGFGDLARGGGCSTCCFFGGGLGVRTGGSDSLVDASE